MKSNCLIFALRKWYNYGGYIVIRKSHHGYFPHFLWCKDLRDAEIEHYVPINPKSQIVKILIHKLLFKGQVKNHDRD